MAIKSITASLPSPTEKLKVQISVGLLDARGEANYCSMYNSGKWQYINVQPLIQLNIKYFMPSKPWSRLDNIGVSPRDLPALKADLNTFYNDMVGNENNIFTYDDYGYISSISNSDRWSYAIKVGKKNAMRLGPIAFYPEETRKPIPGVSLEINHWENRVEMSIDEFELFNDTIQNLQLHQEGMILLHMYMTMCLKNGGLKIPVEEGSGAKQPTEKDVQISIFERAQTKAETSKRNEEIVKGPSIFSQPKNLEDLG